MIKIIAIGRLTKDANSFSYGQGKTGVGFTIASNDKGSEEAEFLNCTMFNSSEKFAGYLEKGNQVMVSGRYSKNDEGYVTCIVDELEFGSKRGSSGGGSSTDYNGSEEVGGGNYENY